MLSISNLNTLRNYTYITSDEISDKKSRNPTNCPFHPFPGERVNYRYRQGVVDGTRGGVTRAVHKKKHDHPFFIGDNVHCCIVTEYRTLSENVRSQQEAGLLLSCWIAEISFTYLGSWERGPL